MLRQDPFTHENRTTEETGLFEFRFTNTVLVVAISGPSRDPGEQSLCAVKARLIALFFFPSSLRL